MLRFVKVLSKSSGDSSKQRKVQVGVAMKACFYPRVAKNERKHHVASVELGVVALVLIAFPSLDVPTTNAHRPKLVATLARRNWSCVGESFAQDEVTCSCPSDTAVTTAHTKNR